MVLSHTHKPVSQHADGAVLWNEGVQADRQTDRQTDGQIEQLEQIGKI
jgi:hypothetical protein